MDKGHPPKCKMCDNVVTWTYKTKSWKTYCSRDCVTLDNNFIRNKTKQTNIRKYGVDHNWSTGVLRDLQHQTMLDKYGVKFPLQNNNSLEKMKRTNIEKYGVECPLQSNEILHKRELTNVERYGVKIASILDITKEKQKQTNLEKYGVEHSTQNKEVQEKQKQTNLERYGCLNPFGSLAIREKIKQTNLEKYGVEHSIQNKEIQEKIKQTNLERYGVEHSTQHKEIQEKIKQTNLEKYGSHFTQQHMIDILPLIQDYSWLFDQYITQDKTAWQIGKENNISDVTIGNYLRKAEIEIKQGFWISYKSQLWLNQQEGIIIPEYKIPGTRYRADGYCPETNTIYEFHGDYWHGNPEIYSPEVINEVNGLTMGELYQNTIERENLIKSLGYNLAVIWENDYIE